MRNKTFFHFIFGIILASNSGLVIADPVEELDDIVVSATRWETQGVPTAGSIVVIHREQIKQSGAKNITEVLRGYGGIQISDLYGDGSRTTISMRGFGANAQSNTLIMVDGRRLNNTDLRAPDLGSIALKDIERIEIIQGSSAVLFGDQAVGGVVNIITMQRSDTYFEAGAGYGSYDTQSQHFIVNDNFDNGLSYRFSGQRSLSNNYRDNNDREYINVLGNVGYQSEHGRFFMEYQIVDEDIELPGGIFQNQVRSNRKQTRFPDDFNDTNTEITRLGTLLNISPEWQFQTEFTSRRENIDGVLTNIRFSQERHHQSLNPRIRGNLPFNDISIVIGGDLEKTDYSLVSFFGGPPAVTNSTQRMYSSYIQAIIPVDDYISVTTGVRKAWLKNEIVDSFSFPAGTTFNDNQFISTFGVTLFPLPDLRLFLKRETNYRFPLVDEETFVSFGIAGLDTQTGKSYETGIEWNRPSFFAKLGGYFLVLENEIDFDPVAGGFGANTNLDPTERTGLIFETGIQLSEKAHFSLHYSYVDAEFSEGLFQGNKIPFVAEHQLLVNADYKLTGYFTLYGEIFMIDERVASGDYANDFQKLPGYAVTNINLDYQYKGLGLSARISNLFNRKYSDFAATAFNPFPVVETGFTPAPERNYLLTLSYTFD